eukprot:6204060-Pleurochrysis_carterae.AAC.1
MRNLAVVATAYHARWFYVESEQLGAGGYSAAIGGKRMAEAKHRCLSSGQGKSTAWKLVGWAVEHSGGGCGGGSSCSVRSGGVRSGSGGGGSGRDGGGGDAGGSGAAAVVVAVEAELGLASDSALEAGMPLRQARNFFGLQFQGIRAPDDDDYDD